MSYDVLVHSSIMNFGSRRRDEIIHVLNSVKNPKWHTDDDLDIVIDEDFDMRHITALVKYAEEPLDKKYFRRHKEE